MKIRIRFAKTGHMRYVGHLDLMRYFQKALRRAEIDVQYSQGFSPHQIMSFASPLGIGLTSEGEYMDIEVNSVMSSQKMTDCINQAMTEGVQVLSCRRLAAEGKTNAMALIAAADYEVRFRRGYAPFETEEQMTEQWRAFIGQPHICILKKTKKSETEMDIRPLILEDQVESSVFRLKLAAGSSQNLKPETVMEAFAQFCSHALSPYALDIHRLDMYARMENGFCALETLGEEIYE